MTTTRRLTLLAFLFLVWTPAAYAWSRPVQGPVLRPFAYDEAHPYAAGQHRGIDIGADTVGEAIVAPAAGTVSFAGTVPTNGKSVTIETADGYSVTLTHLGSIAVGKGSTVAEQDPIGTVGPSGTPEVDVPYVHLGIRVTADPNGYVDPLGLLPPAPAGDSTAPPPTTSSHVPAAPAKKPAPSARRSPRVKTTRGSNARSGRGRVRKHEQQRAHEPQSDARTTRSRHRPVVQTEDGADLHAQQSHPNERTSAVRRPTAEPSAPRTIDLDADRATRLTVPAEHPRRRPSVPMPGLACNLAAALFALGAAFAAGRRRRRVRPSPAVGAQVVHLAPAAVERRRFSRAA